MDNELAKMNDHDLLVTMHEQIKGIKADIRDLKDGTGDKLSDHETRIRGLESIFESFKGRYAILAVVGMAIVSIVTSWIVKQL